MNPVIQWLTQYARICKDLLTLMEGASSGYSDEKLVAIEAAILLREERLEELGGIQINKSEAAEYAPYLEEIKNTESEIEIQIKAMMADLDAQRMTVQEQRSELTLMKRANRSYIGTLQATEGYFIDKKK